LAASFHRRDVSGRYQAAALRSKPKGYPDLHKRRLLFAHAIPRRSDQAGIQQSCNSDSEEAKAVVAGSIAYFGKYTVDDASNVVSIDIQGSTFANQIGSASDNKRIVTSLTANELKRTNPGSASGLKLELVFERAN
jgi:hypothetical protein